MAGDIDRHLRYLDVSTSSRIRRILLKELIFLLIPVLFVSGVVSHWLARLRGISVQLIANGYSLHLNVFYAGTVNPLTDDLIRRRRSLTLSLIVCWVNSESLTVLTLGERILAVSGATRSRPCFTVMMLGLLIPLTIRMRLCLNDLCVLEVDGLGHGADPSTNKLVDIAWLVLQGRVGLIEATVVFYGSSEHRILLQLAL